MYEAEYRLGLQNAGFDGFRVLLFQQDDGINAASGDAGLKFTVDFGLGMLNALNLGDILNDVAYQIRPYEVVKADRTRLQRSDDRSSRRHARAQAAIALRSCAAAGQEMSRPKRSRRELDATRSARSTTTSAASTLR